MGLGVVGAVAGCVPVVDHGAPEGAALPPVVGTTWWGPGEDTRDLPGLVAVVVVQEIGGDEFGCGFYGVFLFVHGLVMLALHPRCGCRGDVRSAFLGCCCNDGINDSGNVKAYQGMTDLRRVLRGQEASARTARSKFCCSSWA